MPLLEIICSTLADALEAERGGADRLELCVALDQEGLTPPLDLVEAIVAVTHIPLRVMVRETNSYQATEPELARMIDYVTHVSNLPIDGLVVGFATARDIDLTTTMRLLDAAPQLNATHQRAFEEAADPFAAIAQLKNLPQFDTLLTNGATRSNGDPTDWPTRIAHLNDFANAASPQLHILAGGGVNADIIRLIRSTTNIDQFHCGRPARENGQVSARRVKELREAMQ